MALAGSVVASAQERWLKEVARAQAQALVQGVTDARNWNSLHGGVYVPVTEWTQPNPNLDVPRRDVVTRDGQQLTLINHAHMTRQIAEIGLERHEVELHLTSLDPLRPLNLPRGWEVAALESFKDGRSEWAEFATDADGEATYRYMAPLKVESSCLPCHERQGYREGQVLGGLGVVVPERQLVAVHEEVRRNGILAIGVIWLMGLGIVVLITRGFLAKQTLLSRLEGLSLVDELTGLLNRRGFLTYADQELRIARRLQQEVLVAYIDIDGMKRVNDTFGHAEGDQALRRLAGVLRSAFRDSDVLARLGGDEFAVLSFDTGGDGAKAIERRLLQQIDLENASRASPCVLAASVGVVEIGPADIVSIEQLLEEADRMMYRRKKARYAASRGEDA